MSIRIGFAGAHRTGKTTLANRCAEKLRLPVLDNPVKESFDLLGFKIGDDLEFCHRMMVQMMVLARFKAKTQMMSGFICDRTPLDYAAYTMAEINNEMAKSLMQTDEDAFAKYLHDCRYTALDALDLVFIVQPGIPVQYEDHKAACSPALMEHINDLVLARASGLFHTNVVIMPRHLTDLEQRVAFVCQHVMEHIEAKNLNVTP